MFMHFIGVYCKFNANRGKYKINSFFYCGVQLKLSKFGLMVKFSDNIQNLGYLNEIYLFVMDFGGRKDGVKGYKPKESYISVTLFCVVPPGVYSVHINGGKYP